MKIRIDQFLVNNNYFETRQQAKTNIMAGNVLVDNEKIIKPGEMINPEKIKEIRIKTNSCKYASRAGLKLEQAIKEMNIDFQDKIVLDVGSSTGGFTDCALTYGAKEVNALDVGTNQLLYRLRNNKRVKVFEQTNFRTIPKDFFGQKFDIIMMDVSFISISLLIENVYNNLKDDGYFVVLIKPQFEAGKEIERTKKGVIKNKKDNENVKNDVVDMIKNNGFKCENIIKTKLKGTNGNQEYVGLFSLK